VTCPSIICSSSSESDFSSSCSSSSPSASVSTTSSSSGSSSLSCSVLPSASSSEEHPIMIARMNTIKNDNSFFLGICTSTLYFDKKFLEFIYNFYISIYVFY